MKPLFQRTSDILGEQNDIAYSPTTHNDWQKDIKRHNFSELPNENTPRFSQEVAPNQRLGCGKIRGILL